MMLHTKYQGSRHYGFIQYFLFSLYKPMLKHMTPGGGPFWPHGHNLNKLGRGPLGDAIYQISRL